MHFCEVGEYAGACDMIFQVMLCCVLFSFKFQTCSLSVVACLFCTFLKDDLCWLNLVLNVHSVRPMYVSVLLLSIVVTVAW